MSNQQHRIQSDNGEVPCLERFLGGEWTVEAAKEWFDQKRIEYLRLWLAT